jgi:hypothetical protein
LTKNLFASTLLAVEKCDENFDKNKIISLQRFICVHKKDLEKNGKDK